MTDLKPPSPDALAAATQFVKEGRLEQARETLMQYLMKNPSSEQAWLLMSYVLSDTAKQKDCLERVLKINPNNTVAQSKLAHLLGRRTEELFRKQPEAPAPAPAPPPIKPAAPPEPKPTPSVKPVSSKPEPKPPAPDAHSKPPEAVVTPEQLAPPQKAPLFSGKWFRIVVVFLVVLILVLLAIIVYQSVIGPVVSKLSSSPTPTAGPVIQMTLPPEWTQTLTPTVTTTPPPTITPTASNTLVPTVLTETTKP
jgi:hypothetical protein